MVLVLLAVLVAVPGLAGVVTGAVVLGVVGVWDDRWGVRVAVKLGVQLAAAFLAVALGLRFGPLVSPLVDFVLTLGWIVCVINAVNFMDGMDGLVPGVGLLAALGFLLVGPGGEPGGEAGVLAVALAAGLGGFLPFNFPRARLFLGDAGSQPLGFLLACLPLLGGGGSGWLMGAMLAGVLCDVAATLLARAWRGARLTEGHREHFYQRAPWPGWVTVLVHWGFVVWAAAHWAMGAPVWLLVPAVLAPQLVWGASIGWSRVRLS